MPYHFFEKRNGEIAFQGDGGKELARVDDYEAACSFQGNLVFGDKNGILTYLQDPNAQPVQLQFSSGKILSLVAPANTSQFLIVTREKKNNEKDQKHPESEKNKGNENSQNSQKSKKNGNSPSTSDETTDFSYEFNFCFTNPNKNDEQANYVFPINDPNCRPFFLTTTDDGKYFAFTVDFKNIVICQIVFKDNIPTKINFLNNFQLIPEDEKDTITGLFFVNNKAATCMYYVTENHAGTLAIDGKKINKKPFPGLSCGAQISLSTVDDRSRLVICNDNKITFYTVNGLDTSSSTVELDNTPIKIMWYKSYLISIYTSSADTLRIYELDTHCVFGSSRFGLTARFILFEWGAVILVKSTGKLTILSEIPTEKKINLLCTSSKQFEIALKLSNKNSMGRDAIAEIRRQLGDAKIARRDYEAAVKEYKETIGVVEPSYVITQFLEPQLAEHLVDYLEALHDNFIEREKVEDKLYTMLRFNCYTKLKRGDSIKKIVDECKDNAKRGKEPNFDVEAAVSVLVKAGYLEEAMEIADTTNQFFSYCSIMEMNGDYSKINEKLRKMSAREATAVIRKYGSKALDSLSQKNPEMAREFTSLVAAACTEGLAGSGGDKSRRLVKVKEVASIFICFPIYEFQFYDEIIEKNHSVLDEELWNRAIIICIYVDLSKLPTFVETEGAKYSYDVVFQAIYMNYVTCKGPNAVKHKISYSKKPAKKGEPLPEDPIDDVAKLNISYYERCLITLYTKRKLYREIILIVEPKEILKYCMKFGDEDPSIWGDAIKIAINVEDPEVFVSIVKEAIENDKIRLNELLMMCKGSKFPSVGLMKELILDQFKKIREEIKDKIQELENDEKELDEADEEATRLETQSVPFRPIRCCHCKEPVSFPVRYFKCGHAFHLSCLGDEAEFCSICAQKHQENAVHKSKQLEEAKQQRQIKPEMENEKKDSMGLLEEALATGIMNTDSIYEEDAVKAFYQKFLGDDGEDDELSNT